MSFRSQMRIRWNHVRDHAGNVRARTGTGTAYRAHVAASDAWYRMAGRRIAGGRQQFWNRRSSKAFARGRRDAAARGGDQVRSRTPVLRNRINPATGRAHRDDVQLGRTHDQALARFRQVMPEVARPRRSGRSR